MVDISVPCSGNQLISWFLALFLFCKYTHTHTLRYMLHSLRCFNLVEIRTDLIEANYGSVVFCPHMAAHTLATPIIKSNRSSLPCYLFLVPGCLGTPVICDVKFWMGSMDYLLPWLQKRSSIRCCITWPFSVQIMFMLLFSILGFCTNLYDERVWECQRHYYMCL